MAKVALITWFFFDCAFLMNEFEFNESFEFEFNLVMAFIFNGLAEIYVTRLPKAI